jgi:hypothetical protein
MPEVDLHVLTDANAAIQKGLPLGYEPWDADREARLGDHLLIFASQLDGRAIDPERARGPRPPCRPQSGPSGPDCYGRSLPECAKVNRNGIDTMKNDLRLNSRLAIFGAAVLCATVAACVALVRVWDAAAGVPDEGERAPDIVCVADVDLRRDADDVPLDHVRSLEFVMRGEAVVVSDRQAIARFLADLRSATAPPPVRQGGLGQADVGYDDSFKVHCRHPFGAGPRLEAGIGFSAFRPTCELGMGFYRDLRFVGEARAAQVRQQVRRLSRDIVAVQADTPGREGARRFYSGRSAKPVVAALVNISGDEFAYSDPAATTHVELDLRNGDQRRFTLVFASPYAVPDAKRAPLPPPFEEWRSLAFGMRPPRKPVVQSPARL